MKPLFMLWLALLLPFLAGAQTGHELFRARRVVDLAGRVHQLGAARGTKLVVLVFLGPECPISQRYVPELNRIAAEQGTNGVEFYGVVSGHFADRAAAMAFQKEYAIRFPILLDDTGALARWLFRSSLERRRVTNFSARVASRTSRGACISSGRRAARRWWCWSSSVPNVRSRSVTCRS